MNTAAILARISRDESGESFSIPAQVQACQEYAKRHDLGIPERNIIIEEYTGTTLERPGMQQLQKLIRSGEIGHVITMKVSRIARKSHLADYFLQEIIFTHGVTLHIVEWGRPVEENKNDIMWFGMQSQFSQFERNDILERTKRGRIQKAKEGIWLGQGTTPYGYRKIGQRRTTALEIIEEEAEIVRYIFNAYLNGERVRDIKDYLNAHDIPSPSIRAQKWHTTPWTSYSVRELLRREIYSGVFTISSHAVERPDLVIVHRNIWLQVQEKLRRNFDKHTFKPRYEYLMRRRLQCVCGYAMGASGNSKKPHARVYRCRNTQSSGCTFSQLWVEHIDPLVWHAIERYIRNIDGCLSDLLISAQAQQQEKHGIRITHEMMVERQNDYDTALLRLYRDLQGGRITDFIYMEEKKAYDHKLTTLKEMYKEQQDNEQSMLTDDDIQNIHLEALALSNVLDGLGEITFEEKEKFIEMLDVQGRFVIDGSETMLYLSMKGVEWSNVKVPQHGRFSICPSSDFPFRLSFRVIVHRYHRFNKPLY